MIGLSRFKVNSNIFIWVLIICILIFLNIKYNNFQSNSDLSKYRENQKKEIRKNIENRDLIIKKLELENNKFKMEINDMNTRIDSLQQLKIKIQIKYVDRVSNIKIMDSEEIKNYWYEEFN